MRNITILYMYKHHGFKKPLFSLTWSCMKR